MGISGDSFSKYLSENLNVNLVCVCDHFSVLTNLNQPAVHMHGFSEDHIHGFQ